MKKILLIITGLTAGGAERVVVNLADYYTSKNNSVTLVFMTDNDKIFFLPKNKNVKIVDLQIKKNPISLLKGFYKFVKLLRTNRFDVIHSHMYHANIFSCFARLITPMNRLICSSHSTNEGGYLRMLLYRLTDSIPDIRTNVSQEAVDLFEKKNATKKGNMVVVTNGIDTEHFKFSEVKRDNVRQRLQINDDENLILAAGRLTEAKGFPILIHAIKKATFSINNIKLVIAGAGPLEESLKEQAQKLGLADRIIFLGIYNDMPALMSAADMFVLSSLWEGFGLVVAEAMSCERVVVATDSGGVKEVLGTCGFLVPHAEPALLAEQIINGLLLNKAAKIDLGKQARERVIKNFSIEKNAQMYFSLY